MIRPLSIIMVRSPVASAEDILWVIIMVVMLFSATISLVMSITFLAVTGSSAAVCSSKSSSLGVQMVHISKVTTCRCPPDSRPILVFIRSSSPILKRDTCSRKKLLFFLDRASASPLEWARV